MSLNRNARPLKSYDRLEREMYRREERRDLDAPEDRFLLGSRPKRGELHPVNEQLVINEEWFPLVPNVCMHCWTIIMPSNSVTGVETYSLLLRAAAKGVRGMHKDIQDKAGERDDPNWIHATTGQKRCYRDAGCRATYMPGIYLIEELVI